ncbi:hypothetical protein [Paenibacillus sp. H1-7]|uniref:hypothetical protein n=1 Tax=Paenibacillus sp. H1-7 TaxID=2282849 RepID=UPI001EF92735|nr:hypothetical protein [Paenibacillus sp. H1-7]
MLLIITVVVLGGCTDGSYTSTTSYLKVTDKKYSDDYKEAWIMAYNPYDSEKKNVIKIVVEEPVVWNLIEKDREYFSSYSKKGEEPWVLEQIAFPSDEKALR